MNENEELKNPDVHYEPGDVNAIFLTKFGIGMMFTIAVFLFGLWGLFSYFKAREAKEGVPPSAVVRVREAPPEPRLQVTPESDLKQMRADEEQIMHQYAWLDPDKGIVRIPIERAMDLVAQRGLTAAANAPVSGTGQGKKP